MRLALFFCVRVVLDMRPDTTQRFKIINYVLRYDGVISIVSVSEQIFDKQKTEEGLGLYGLLFLRPRKFGIYRARLERLKRRRFDLNIYRYIDL